MFRHIVIDLLWAHTLHVGVFHLLHFEVSGSQSIQHLHALLCAINNHVRTTAGLQDHLGEDCRLWSFTDTLTKPKAACQVVGKCRQHGGVHTSNGSVFEAPAVSFWTYCCISCTQQQLRHQQTACASYHCAHVIRENNRQSLHFRYVPCFACKLFYLRCEPLEGVIILCD